MTTTDPADVLVPVLHYMGRQAADIGSPFYGRLCQLMADDVGDGGPSLDLLGPTAVLPVEGYYPLRLLGAVHLLVLEGQAPALEAHYPSVGGDGDADAAWPHVRAILAARPPVIDALLDRIVQTNEPSRAGVLIVGFLEVADRWGLPIRALELGSSAGLNLRLDRFRYESPAGAFGPADSPMRFVDYWRGSDPAFDAPLDIVERRGCDLDPVDLSDPAERTRLLAYVWPDQLERLAANRAAVEIVASVPATVDRAPIPDWLDEQLAPPSPSGQATVVFHSIVWVYLDDDTRQRVTSTIDAAGQRATPDAPLAWLSYEEEELASGEVCLRLRTWPDGDNRVIATGSFHHSPVTLRGR